VKRIFDAPLGYPHKVLEWAQVDCQALASESRARLSRLAPKGVSALRVSSPLGRCAQCHSIDPEGAGAPRIPFDEPVELGAWLRNPTRRLSRKIHARIHRRGPGQMPPDEPLSADEAEALEAALQRIREL
jgi:mono/diheme cytochrome c family protein